MAQATISFQNKNVHAVKKLTEWLISKEFRIIAIVFDASRGDGFVVTNKFISDTLRGEILDWNYYNCESTDLQKGFNEPVMAHGPGDDSASG